MKSNWRTSTWGDEISLEYGKAIRDYRSGNGSVRVFGSNGPVGWTTTALAKGPGVILGRKGAYRGVEFSPHPFFVIDTAYYVVPKSDLDMRWLYYAIKHHKLGEIDDGSPIPSTTRSAVYVRDLEVPPLAEQKRIAHILGTLDDKIELNRRMNATLEAMARALFQSWFVDYGPVRAKAAGQTPAGMDPATADLFPSEFEDSELGEIPKGWRVASLGESVTRVAMGPFGSSIKTDNFVPNGVPIIRGGNLTNGFVDKNFVFLTEEKADSLRNANAFPGDLVITHRGTLGQIGLIPTLSRYPRYVVSQSQMLVRIDPAKMTAHYLYLFLTSYAGQHSLLANRNQTGVPAIAQPTSSVKAIRLLLPPPTLVHAFEKLAAGLFERAIAGTAESRTLAALRDALLPKLLSGELSVDSAKVEAAI